MSRNNMIQVWLGSKKVGTLAELKDFRIAFEYDKEWLESGFSISPFSLPLRQEVFIPKGYEPFEGLFGVFADSLPDGWGRLLVDRMLNKNGLSVQKTSSIYRLAVVGEAGMGALEYIPEITLNTRVQGFDLDDISEKCRQLLETGESDSLDTLFRMGGSSGGARSKILQKIEGQDWIIKFPSSIDRKNIGKMEYDYSLCAKKCGIEMSETALLTSNYHQGYFATKRFDREKNVRKHMVSVSGLLETSHRVPNLDYHILMHLTLNLTKVYKEVEKMYRLMCFNVFAHNRDDHSKNFSFLYDESNRNWELSPAYDLTYSNSIGDEHATTINGNGINPSLDDILEVARKAKIQPAKAKNIAEEIREIVQSELREYLGK